MKLFSSKHSFSKYLIFGLKHIKQIGKVLVIGKITDVIQD